MNIHKIHAPRHARWGEKRRYHIHYLCIALAGLIMVLALSAGSAWSFEVQDNNSAQSPSETGATSKTFSRTGKTTFPAAGSCLTLLKSLRETASLSPAENYRHTAGTSAAFGLVIGLRFALTQAENKRSRTAKARKPQLGIWQMQNPEMEPRHALALGAYRDCQNRQALKALSGLGSDE